MSDNRNVMIFAIHRTVDWWKYLGQNLGWGTSTVVTDLRGQGDVCVVDDFYAELKRLRAQSVPRSSLLSEQQTDDIIARCRALRWLDPHLAMAMTHAMAIALDRVLERVNPRVVLSFTMDRYVKDVLARLADARGIKHFELTAAPFPHMSMLLSRGALIRVDESPAPEVLEAKSKELASPAFVPTYVRGKTKYTRAKFLRTMGYFRTRSLAFRAIGLAQRDYLNCHYLDAQQFLGHKAHWKDIRVVDLCDNDWRERLKDFPAEKRVFFGLQLFPEASIDYWIHNRALIDHESLIVQAARQFSNAGYLVLIKDHPLQFGFRRTDFLLRLLAIPNTVLVPYAVSGNEVLSTVKVNFSCTGTLGLQAALAGLTSVVTDSYYSNDQDFVVFRDPSDIKALPARVEAANFNGSLEERQRRIIEPLLRGSFEGDLFSFKGFDPTKPSPAALALSKSIGKRLDQFVEGGQL